MTTKTHRQTHIDRIRQSTNILLAAIDDLNELRAAWDAGIETWIVDASGSNPDAEGYTPGDFDGCRGLMKADIASVVGTSLDALNALLAAGHRTNLEKIRP